MCCLDHLGIHYRGFYNWRFIQIVERFVGLIQDKNRQQNDDAVFAYTKRSSEKPVCPAEMNGPKELREQSCNDG